MMPISSPFLRSSILLSLLSGATLSSPAAVAQARHDAPSPPQASPPSASPPAADEAGTAAASTQEVAEVVVTVERPPGDSLRATHAGSVAAVTAEELDRQKASNLGEVLARIPGVIYVDEDGRGTKPNIGLRGLDPIRSEYVQLLADGVPTQPSMYSEQAAYYGVPAERVIGIDVYKGGASVLFGPNTVGGVVDVISRVPSLRPVAVVLDARLDSNPDALGNVFVSGTQGGLSYGVEYLRKRGEGFRDGLEYSIDDLDLELGYAFNEDHSARAHLQIYDERSETPGGLLPDQFRRDVTVSNKRNDEFFGQRIEGDVRTRHQFGPHHRLETLAYAYYFKRDWYLQNYTDNAGPDLTLADNNSQFLRDFQVMAFEPKYTLDYDLGPAHSRLTLGGRVYYDEVDRHAAAGNTGTSREGDYVTTSYEELSSFVLAAYAQEELELFERLSIVPGVRFEHIEQTRQDLVAQTPEQSTDYSVWVPGIGLKYELFPRSLVYANVTRAFRPPSFGDSFNPAIAASSFDLKASTAWTYEGGVRLEPYPWLQADLGGFYTSFADQVVISAGVADNYDTRSYGFEGSAQVGVLGLAQAATTARPTELFLQGGLSLVDASFANGAFEGNTLPYAAKLAATFGALLDLRGVASLTFQGRHVGARFTDNANTRAENAIGTIGELSAYTVFDLKARWHVVEPITLHVGVNNLFDELYATQRRTGSQKGLFPGPTRTFYLAANATF